jgi:serine/threonine-protein kinase
VEFATEGFLVAGRYALGRKIGSGGMGAVWLAHDQKLDRLCALKIVDPDKANNDEIRKRFFREARATAQIQSAHVVEVFEYGIWDGIPFIVMELLDGEELGARLERLGVLDFESAHRIIAQVARGLARAHALGIVHRDLKPENVFLVQADGDEIVKLFDFGIAHHVVYSPRDHATKAGAVMGTPCFMSPEQALGEPTDWRSDLWALGVLGFQCLTGKLPFLHDALGGLLSQILYEPIPSIRAANPALSPRVEAWWRRASERDRERRFQDAAELSDALADALGLRTRLAVPKLVPNSEALTVDPVDFEDASGSAVEFAERMGSDAPVALDTGELITRFRRKVRRRSAWVWGLIAAVLSALFGAGVWFRERLVPPRAVSRFDAHGLLPPRPAALPPLYLPPLPVPNLPDATTETEEAAPEAAPELEPPVPPLWRERRWPRPESRSRGTLTGPRDYGI